MSRALPQLRGQVGTCPKGTPEASRTEEGAMRKSEPSSGEKVIEKKRRQSSAWELVPAPCAHHS